LLIYLLLGISFGFASAVQPGPFQTFLISRTLAHGWRNTLISTCAPLISDIPILVLVLLILNRVPFGVENIIHFAGGIFLLYLAIGAFKSFKNYSCIQTTEPHSAGQNLFKGVIVNLLNPNPYLAWSLVMGPLLLKGWQETPCNGITLILSFYITLILSSSAIILIFATLRKLGTKITRILVGISIIALAGFGIYQLWLGIATL